jgi:hypothetical protein
LYCPPQFDVNGQLMYLKKRQDPQQNDTQYNDTQQNDTQQNDTQHKNINNNIMNAQDNNKLTVV